MTAPRVVSTDGDWLELWGQNSTRELLVVLGLSAPNAEMCDVEGVELCWTRDQVVQLRDQLNAWLALGEL